MKTIEKWKELLIHECLKKGISAYLDENGTFKLMDNSRIEEVKELLIKVKKELVDENGD